MAILITTASILFFSNKILLLLGKKVDRRVGWFCGTIGALLFIIYFFLIQTQILSVLEIGLTILMLYRFTAHEKTNKTVEYVLGVLTAIFIIILTVLASKGTMSIAQFLGAFGMLIGTYLLISSKQQSEYIGIKERYGWLLYGFGHFFTSYIGYQKHEWVFFIFQAWQMLLCLSGFLARDSIKKRLFTKVSLILGGIASLIFVIFISKIN